jgi:hypothetical protein
MGLVKSEAQRKANQLQRKAAIAAADEKIIKGPRPATWSARMPAYAGTSLCPDPELRRVPDE